MGTPISFKMPKPSPFCPRETVLKIVFFFFKVALPVLLSEHHIVYIGMNVRFGQQDFSFVLSEVGSIAASIA